MRHWVAVDKLSECIGEAQYAVVCQARARRFGYGIRALLSAEGRPIVVLGETHLKLPGAWATGKAAVDAFAERGVETARIDWPALRWFVRLTIGGPRSLLRLLSLGFIRGSTITYARSATHGHTTMLEAAVEVPGPLLLGFVYTAAVFFLLFGFAIAATGATIAGPLQAHLVWLLLELLPLVLFVEVHLIVTMVPAYLLRGYRYAWLINPAITILTSRDAIMAQGTAAMLRERPGDEPVLTIMGRGHLPGYVTALVDHHGFTALEVD